MNLAADRWEGRSPEPGSPVLRNSRAPGLTGRATGEGMVWQGGSMTELSQAVAAPVIDQADTYRHRARFIWPLEVVAAVLLVAAVRVPVGQRQ